MPLLSLQKSKSIVEFLFWISLLVILFAFFSGLWNVFFVFLMLSSLLFLEYFLISMHIKKKSKDIAKKTEIKKTDKEKKSKEKGILKKPAFFSWLVARRKLTEKEIKKKQQMKKGKEENSKKKNSTAKKSSFFDWLPIGRKLTEEEIKEKEALNRKIREIKLAENMAKIEKQKEKKRLKELMEKINAERKLREKGLKASMSERKLKSKSEEYAKRRLEKEKRLLERLENEKRKILDEEAKLEKIKRGGKEPSAKDTKEQSIQLRDRYETDLDKLVSLVDRYERLKLSEVAEVFKIDKKIAEEWANILEQHNLLSIHYPAIGEPELRRVKK